MRRADDHDRAALALFDHLPRGRAQRVKGAPHGHVDGAAEAGHVGLVERLAIAVGRVGHGDVEPAEAATVSATMCSTADCVGHVGLQQQCPAGRPPDFVRDLFGLRHRANSS